MIQQASLYCFLQAHLHSQWLTHIAYSEPEPSDPWACSEKGVPDMDDLGECIPSLPCVLLGSPLTFHTSPSSDQALHHDA